MSVSIPMPPDGAVGTFLVNHDECGFMLAKWLEAEKCFAAVGFSAGPSPFQVVAIRDDQVPLIEWLKKL